MASKIIKKDNGRGANPKKVPHGKYGNTTPIHKAIIEKNMRLPWGGLPENIR